MRRPFAVLGFSYLAAQITAVCLGPGVALALVILGLGVVAAAGIYKPTRSALVVPVAVLTFSLGLFVYVFSWYSWTDTVKPLDKQDINISGVICDLPQKMYGKYYYIVQIDEINGKRTEKTIKTRLTCNEAIAADVYDRISTKVHMFVPEDELGLSSKSMYSAKGVHILCYSYEYEDIKVSEGVDRPVYYYVLKMRKAMMQAVNNLLPERQASVGCGILFGENLGVDQEVKSAFADAGISHLFAVSGVHMAVVSRFVLLLFMSIFKRGRAAYAITVAVILGFMAITGFAPSVVRSGIMAIVGAIGCAFYRKADSMNSLGFAVLVLVVINPFAAGNIGFLLSVMATFGIIIAAERIEKALILFGKMAVKKIAFFPNHLCSAQAVDSLPGFAAGTTRVHTVLAAARRAFAGRRKPPALASAPGLERSLIKGDCEIRWRMKRVFRYVASSIAVSIAAEVFTSPIAVLVFRRLSLVGVITNILVSFAVAFAIICTLLAPVLSFAGPVDVLSRICALVAGEAIEFIIWCAQTASCIPFAVVSLARPFVMVWFGGTLLLLSLAVFFEKHTKIVAASSCMLLFCGVISSQLLERDSVTLRVWDVGNGCFVSLAKNGHGAVFACGGDKPMSGDCLFDQGVKSLDVLMVPSFLSEETSFARRLAQKARPERVIVPKMADKLEKITPISENMNYFSKDAQVDLWGNVSAKAVCESGKVWTRIQVNEILILICPNDGNAGDAPKEFLNCDFVIFNKLPKGLDEICAEYAIVSSDEDRYRMNLKSVIMAGKTPLATAGDGAIQINFDVQNKICIKRSR